MKAAWGFLQRRFPWIATVATVTGVALAVRSQWVAIVGLDWSRSWDVLALGALAFAIPPLVQAISFWVSLRLLGIRAPLTEAMQIWGRAFVVRYAPTGALSVVYRVRERDRLGATSQQVLLATAYEHLGSLAAGALVCVVAFLAAGGAPPFLALAIGIPVAGLAVLTRPRFSRPLLNRLAGHLGMEEPPLLRGRQLAAVVSINGAGIATALVLSIRLVTTLGEALAVGLIELGYLAVRLPALGRGLNDGLAQPIPVPSARVRSAE